jgi:energy-coupling factor transporter ATP-binding protein EcfA2
MKLKSVVLRNFRCYQNETRIQTGNLTALIGKNDVGKSTILEALEIFFNNTAVKIDPQDACIRSGDKEITIGCEFDDLPDELVLDETATTTLKDEYLLNERGCLEIHKVFDCGTSKVKESVFALAHHPKAELLLLKNADLKKRFAELKLDRAEAGVSLASNPSLRKAIWSHTSDLQLTVKPISLEKTDDAKEIWTKLKAELPLFALFQSDRPSRDEDSEVQDPMKIAVGEALKELEPEISAIKITVQEKVTEVAGRTLAKLREMDATLASELAPHFKAEPKWDTLFKMTLTSDDQIPINKRGSGVRRLILLNFFRAEAERKQKAKGGQGIIYAIEEPETSQHPAMQRLIIQAFMDLTETAGCQVMITTHVPGLAGLLPVEGLRYIYPEENGSVTIASGESNGETLYDRIANDLGVIPDRRVQVLICVEGPHDVNFFTAMSRILREQDDTLPNLDSDPRIAYLPMGGSTLKQWTDERYLRGLHLKEVHIYDRGPDTPPKYQQNVDDVNGWGPDHYAVLTGKREAENYLHPDAIREEMDVTVAVTDQDSVPEAVARAMHEASGSPKPWDELGEKTKGDKISNAKRRLNGGVVTRMTHERLSAMDTSADIESFLRQVATRLTPLHLQAEPPVEAAEAIALASGAVAR